MDKFTFKRVSETPLQISQELKQYDNLDNSDKEVNRHKQTNQLYKLLPESHVFSHLTEKNSICHQLYLLQFTTWRVSP